MRAFRESFGWVYYLNPVIQYICLNYLVHTGNNVDHGEPSEKQKRALFFGK